LTANVWFFFIHSLYPKIRCLRERTNDKYAHVDFNKMVVPTKFRTASAELKKVGVLVLKALVLPD
jgi:hypothetical protein